MAQRLSLAGAMLAMMRIGRAERASLANVTFGQWLAEHGQSPESIRRFYDPILISALNEESARASAAYAVQVFQEAMMVNSRGYLLGLPTCALARLYGNPPCSDIRTSTRVVRLTRVANRITGVELADGDRLEADALVLATSRHSARRLLGECGDVDARLAQCDQLQDVPILGAHLWFDRPVLAESHAALLSGPLQWLFRKSEDGRQVLGVISAVRDWVGFDREKSLSIFDRQIKEMLPSARGARLLRGTIILERRATFSPAPGSDAWRPPQSPLPGGLGNLYLAGDYTQTGWPVTMEGAVRSGYLAAEAILPGRRFLVDDLSSEWPMRLAESIRPRG